MERDESEAIQQVLRGDRDGYRLLVERHYATAYRLAFRITSNAEDAEEAAQDAFLRAYRKLEDFRRDSNFSTWVNRIAMNSALNIVERRTRDLAYTAARLDDAPAPGRSPLQIRDSHAGPERTLLAGESTRLRQEAMSTLTLMERTAFTMRHMEDLSIVEIAEALRVPTNSAKQAVFRAVSKLRFALAPLAGGAR